MKGLSKRAQTRYYYPQVSEAWMRAAFDAGGCSAVCLGLVLWQRVKLDFNRQGGDPLEHFAVLTWKRVRNAFPMASTTFKRALDALKAAGLVDTVREAHGQAYRVRIIPLPNEDTLVRQLLSWSTDRPRKRKHS